MTGPGTPARTPPVAGDEPRQRFGEPPARRCSCALSRHSGRDAPSPGRAAAARREGARLRAVPRAGVTPPALRARRLRAAEPWLGARPAPQPAGPAPPRVPGQDTRRPRGAKVADRDRGLGGAASPGTSEGAG